MRLLVSVSGPEEVPASLAGGADIVDAKDPTRGALGAVAPSRLAAIEALLPADLPFSVALGDGETPSRVGAGIESLPIRARSAPVYVKLGFLGVPREGVPALLGSAIAAAARHRARPRIVAVAYADADDSAPSPEEVSRAAATVGATGVLLDTINKDGRTLLDHRPMVWIRGWAAAARARGLLVAVAGSLGPMEVARMAEVRADIVGVRGAACMGGRAGRVSAHRVRLLRACLAEAARGGANGETSPTAETLASILK